MARIERFEDIEAWKKARELTKLVYRLANEGSFARDFALKDQIRRATISIMSNIAEGFERGGDQDSFTSWRLPRAPAVKRVASFTSLSIKDI